MTTSMPRSIHIAKGPINFTLTLPGSNSITLRALLLAALADGVSELSGIATTSDVLTFINALQNLGIITQLDQQARTCIIAGGNGSIPKKQAVIWCDKNKLVADFLLTLCATSPGIYYFDGDKNLRSKPFSTLRDILCRKGCQIIPVEAKSLPFTLIGADSLQGGDIILDADSTNRLVSALLIIAPLARSPFNFYHVEVMPQPYLDMTCKMMAEFGVLVHRIHQGQIMVPIPQRYQAQDYIIEPDFTTAAYFFAAAAVTGGELTLRTPKRSIIRQSSIKFFSLLERMGCIIIDSPNQLTLKAPKALQGIEADMHDYSDLLLPFITIAAFAKTPSNIRIYKKIHKRNLARLKNLQTELHKLGIDFEIKDSHLSIQPGSPHGGITSSHNSYQLGMALSVIGLKTPGLGIDNIQPVLSYCPEFYILWDKMVAEQFINI